MVLGGRRGGGVERERVRKATITDKFAIGGEWVEGERVRKATITDKFAIDRNNVVKVINHSQLLELSLIYIYASLLRTDELCR